MKYENEKKSHELLRDRFDTLEHNHKQLIKIKDEYKKENGSLRKENERLKTVNDNLFSEAIEEKDGIISKLNKDLLELHSKLEDAGKREKYCFNYVSIESVFNSLELLTITCRKLSS